MYLIESPPWKRMGHEMTTIHDQHLASSSRVVILEPRKWCIGWCNPQPPRDRLDMKLGVNWHQSAQKDCHVFFEYHSKRLLMEIFHKPYTLTLEPKSSDCMWGPNVLVTFLCSQFLWSKDPIWRLRFVWKRLASCSTFSDKACQLRNILMVIINPFFSLTKHVWWKEWPSNWTFGAMYVTDSMVLVLKEASNEGYNDPSPWKLKIVAAFAQNFPNKRMLQFSNIHSQGKEEKITSTNLLYSLLSLHHDSIWDRHFCLL